MPLKGQRMSEEHKQNISLAKIGHSVSIPTRNKIAKTLTGRKHTEQWKAQQSERSRLWWQNPENREKQAKCMAALERRQLAPWKGKKLSAQHRRHISEGVNKTSQLLRLKHKELIFETAKDLEKQGFRSIIVDVRSEVPQPDLIAIKHGKVYAVEIEIGRTKPRFKKYLNYNPYDDVWWLQRK